MATKEIVIHIDDEEVKVVLKSAKKADGIWRGQLMSDAIKMEEGKSESMVAFYLYPTCMASVKEPEKVRQMSLDDFINKVDEADIDMWLKEAYELNPQWKRGMQDLVEMTEEQSKKLGTPSNGSTLPTEEMPVSQETSPTLKN